MKSVWLTRSFIDNLELEQQLKSYNFRLINQPLITYVDDKKALDQNIVSKYKNIIITSKRAAEIISCNSLVYKNSEVSAWVVGNSAAQILQEAGLNIQFIALNVEQLIINLPKSIYSEMIYLSSNMITKALPKKIRRLIIYKVKYNTKLSKNEVDTFAQGVDYILLYSKNCAKTLIQVINKYQLHKLKNSTLITLSLKIAKELYSYFNNVLYCDEERQNTIIKLLIMNEKYETQI